MTPVAASALVDTSVAVALLLQGSEYHFAALDAVAGHTVGIAGHAVIETCSVLSRLPGVNRLEASTAWRLVQESFVTRRWLTPSEQEVAINRACAAGVSGGALYDALVGAAAAAAGLPLITRDRRALSTYAAIGVEALLVDVSVN